jgi:drug/metabolite transporter (DMT)-like permease
MVRIPWYITAVGAALVWGIHYPLIDNALKKVSLMSVLLLTALPIVVVTPLFYKTLASDYRTLAIMAWPERSVVLALGLTSFGATALLFLSIGSKNATLASLIEISYPVFVAMFSYLLFREIQVNASVLLGGLLVFAGVGLIILNNP